MPVDGILAMEGDGPGKGGKPRHMGLLLGGSDAFSVDAVACRAVGLSEEDVPTLKTARRMSLFNGAPSIHGPLQAVDAFQFPVTGKVIFGPAPFQRILRRTVLQRPVVDPDRCRQCGECWFFLHFTCLRRRSVR